MQLKHHFELPAIAHPNRQFVHPKILLVMRLTAFFMLITCCQISAKGLSQTITLSEKNVPVERIFQQVEKQTGVIFLYNNKLFEKLQHVTVVANKASLREVLEQCFEGLPFTYSVVDNTIVIKLKEPTPALSEDLLPPPPIEIKGKITDEKSGEPIIGASITFKGTTRGATSNKDGEFSLTIPRAGTLVISYIGYESKEIPIKESGNVDIKLAVTDASMKDMVVTGIFSRPKANFTGASNTFSIEDLNRVTNNSVLNALKALDPSFQLPENINLGSNPNNLPEVVLRGGNSLVDQGQAGASNPFNYTNNPNTPLFILDGFESPLQRINDLDMNRITSVTILKDAAATAIYGSRAANGVIVIETKQPQGGALRFSYTGNLIVEAPDLTDYDLLNAEEKLALEVKAGAYNSQFNNNTQNNLNILYNARLADIRRGVNTDWIAQPVRTGVGQKHNIYLEGGANAALYGINLTYDHRNGVMKESDRQNIAANTFLSYRLKNFQFKNDLTLNFNKSNNSPYGSFTQYTRLNPYWSPFDNNGTIKPYLEEVYNLAGQRIVTRDNYNNLDGAIPGRPTNPLYNASLNIKDQSTYKNFVNNFFIQWQATQWLKVSSRIAYMDQSDESDRFLPAQHTSFTTKPTFEKGSYTKIYGKRSSLEGMLTADANKSFGKSLIFATIGMNVQQVKANTQSFTVQGFPNPRLDQLTLGNRFPDGSKPIGTEYLSRLFGVLSSVSYAYDSRFLLDLSYRVDGSSQFGNDSRYAPFWSTGVGWNLQNESFVRELGFIDRLKLRYSFGYTGSQNFPSFLGTTTSQYYTNNEYRGVISTYLLGYGNAELAWQKTQKNNIGIDLSLFKRLSITANYFEEKTKGSIATISTPPSTGFNAYAENLGNVLGKGWELNVSANILQGKARDNWSVFVNLFHVKSEIQKVSSKLAAMNKRADTTLGTRPIIRYAEGQSTTAIWTVRSLGIDPATGNEVFLSRDGKVISNYSPLDQVISGDIRPDIEGTFGSNYEKNGIGFNVIFRFRYGGQAFNQTLIERVENVDVVYYNVDRRVSEERWFQPGDRTFFKGLVGPGGSPIKTYASSRFVEDDNTLSCESASVYYRFSDRLNKRLGTENSKITFFTTDLFRVSSIKRERGLDYPFGRTFTLQLQTTF